MPTDNNTNKLQVSFTIVHSDSDIGKKFSAPDGKTIVKQVLGVLYAGTATTQILNGTTAGDILAQYGTIVLGLPINHVTLMGTAVNGKPENRLTTKAREGLVAGEIARTKENFAYREPLSLLLIDNDGGKETRQALCDIHPPLKDVAMLTIPSSSSAVMLHGVPAKDGGEHTYILLRSCRQKEVLKRLLDLFVIKGQAYIMISKCGSMMLRGPVDASEWSAERVVFPGVNHVVAPVTQGERTPQLWEGDVLDVERFLFETDNLVDQAELKRIIDEMKAKKLDEADRVAEEWGRNRVKAAFTREAVAKETAVTETLRKRVETQVKRMVDKVKRANRIVGPAWNEREHEVLEADFIITLSDGTQVTVREIRADPAKYDEKHCADPIEGAEYGASTATILLNGRGEPWIYSHAHGASTDYSLVVRELIDPSHEFASMGLEQLLAEASGRGKCPKPDTPAKTEESVKRGRDAELMIRAAVASKADDAVRETLKKALDYMAGLKPATFNKLWKEAKDARDRFEAEAAEADHAGEDEPPDQPPRGYRVVGDWMCRMVREGNATIDTPICHPLRVVSRGRTEKGEDWGVLVEFADLDDKLHRVPIPMTLLGGDAREALDMLTNAGLHLAGADKFIRMSVIDLITKWVPDTRTTVANKMGWVAGNKAFVLGNGTTIGDPSYVFQPVGAVTRNARGMQPRGRVEDWRDGVAALCPGNPVMMVAVSAAFAGPLLDIVGAEGGGIHLRGGSSSGKTTALKAAASVWGDPESATMTWRATSNGIEAIAAAANSTLLVLDDIGMVKGSEAGQTAYMIANGQGKNRADRTGDAREARTWRTMFLSSGEQDLESKMNEDGLKRRAGQEVRLIDFVADNSRFGVFEDLHGSPGGAAFADRIKAAASAVHGTAGPRLVEQLITDIDGSRRQVIAHMDSFVRRATVALGSGIASQVQRAMRQFAVIAAGGEMATGFGITGWRPGAASSAALAVLTAWIDDRGVDASTNAEQRTALEAVRDHLLKHGASRYEGHPPRYTLDFPHTTLREGWVDDEYFWIADGAWKEIHAGANHNQAAKTLATAGYLLPGDGRNIKRKKHGLPARCYCIKKSILNARAGKTAEENDREDRTLVPESANDTDREEVMTRLSGMPTNERKPEKPN